MLSNSYRRVRRFGLMARLISALGIALLLANAVIATVEPGQNYNLLWWGLGFLLLGELLFATRSVVGDSVNPIQSALERNNYEIFESEPIVLMLRERKRVVAISQRLRGDEAEANRRMSVPQIPGEAAAVGGMFASIYRENAEIRNNPEHSLTYALEGVAGVVAIGEDPADGPALKPSFPGDWQRHVLAIAEKVPAVFVCAGNSDAVSWEVEQIALRPGLAAKTVIVADGELSDDDWLALASKCGFVPPRPKYRHHSMVFSFPLEDGQILSQQADIYFLSLRRFCNFEDGKRDHEFVRKAIRYAFTG